MSDHDHAHHHDHAGHSHAGLGHGDHGGHHHHVPEGDRALGAAVAVNLGLTVVELVGGVVSGSVSLIADAIHNLSDAASLVIAWGARRIARRPTDGDMTFGYRRAELVAALINYTTLVVIGLWLVAEGIGRFLNPPEVDGVIMIWVATVALVIDGLTAALTWKLSKDSLNIRAAFLHNLADAAGSVAVIVVGGLVWAFDWRLADPIATLGIAAYILWMALSEVRAVIRILMLGSPPGMDPGAVLAAMEGVAGVENVHHLHVWQISEHTTSLEAHVVVAANDLDGVARIKAALREMLAARFGVSHVTLDTETPGTDCPGVSKPIGG